MTPGKRGAPRGNRNAVKHGFYSRACTHVESRSLSRLVLDVRQDYFDFFKVIISRTLERIKPSAANPVTFPETVLALHTVVLAVNRLQGTIDLNFRLAESRQNNDLEVAIKVLKDTGVSQNEIDDEIYEPLPVFESVKNRGGQPGNNNALRNGLFARHYSPDEKRRLMKLDSGDLTDETGILQILMKRVFVGMQGDISLIDHLKAVRTLAQAGACLDRIRRYRFLLVASEDPNERAYRELSTLPFEED